MATLAEKWIQQGLEQGLERGVAQGKREFTLDSLKMRFDPLPETIVKAVNETHCVPLLNKLHRQAILAKSLADFVQELP